MGKLVNKRELAETIGVSERTFTEWQRDATFPIEASGGRGAENAYDTAKVIQWMIDREVSRRAGEKPRDRLDRVKADMVELELAERLGQLAPAAMFERAWADHIVAAKVELMTMGHRLVADIHSLHGVAVDSDLILSRVEEACTKLEKYDVDLDPDQSEDPLDDDGDGLADD
jgi:terminase small subunit / prophage DNA-packing protein